MSEIVNPYIAGAPVTEQRMFFGRQDIFQWIENSIAGQYADHILVIHGQRRVGKTSVLKQLGNRLPKRFIPVFFDLQGRTHTTLDHFLWWLAREIVRVLRQERGLEIPPPDKDAFTADPEAFENQFLAGLRALLGSDTLLLTFDEFDNLEETEVKEELARPLIDYLRRLMGQPGLNFIFSIGSSGRKLENMQAAYTDFFKTALYKKISFLSEEQTHLLVARPVEGVLEYERQAVERIYAITSGHPYFTQLTCHELFARCQRTGQRQIARADVEAVLDDVVERGTVNLKFVWDEASDIEKWSLAASAQLDRADNRFLSDYLRKNRVRFSESDLTSGLLHLREKDVLTSENRFVIHLMRLWLQKNRPIDQVREELTEANPIASRFIEIGLEFRDGGDYEKAIEYFRQALSVAPGNLQAQVNIALAYAAQDQLEGAVAEFEKALALDDEDVVARAGLCEAHLKLGDLALGKGRAQEAVRSYQRLLEINAEHTEARQRMAEIVLQRARKALADGRDGEALDAFQEALEYTPEDPAINHELEAFKKEKAARLLAVLLARSEKESRASNWEAAVATLTEAAALSPDDAGARSRLDEARRQLHDQKLSDLKARARLLAEAEKFTPALEAWQEVLSLDPADQQQVQDEIARLNRQQELYGIYAEAGQAMSARDFDRAIRLLKEVIYRDETYKDASRLLTRAIEQRRTAPKKKAKEPRIKSERVHRPKAVPPARGRLRPAWIVAGLVGIVVIALGVLFGPRLLADISSGAGPSPVTATDFDPLAGLPQEAAFLQPILAHVATSPPDFEDDFSTDNWGELATGVQAADFLSDGSLLLDLEAGTATEKLVLGGSNIEAYRFALEFDFYYEGGTGSSYLGVGFPSNSAGRGGYVQVIMSYQKWSIGLTDDSQQVGDEIVTDLQGRWSHVQVILDSARAAIFLDGKFMGLAEGIAHDGETAWIYATTGGQARAYLDNLKFWNLGKIASALDFAAPIFAFAAGTSPDFEEDFTTPKEYWSTTQVDPVSTLADRVSDGVFHFSDESDGITDEGFAIEGLGQDFLLEFDYGLLLTNQASHLIVQYRTAEDQADGFKFNPYSLGLQPLVVAHKIIEGAVEEVPLGEYHFQVLVQGNQLAIYINRKLVLFSEQRSPLAGSGLVFLAHAEGGFRASLDNIRFWNLDAEDSLDSILAYLAGTAPDFTDDFSSDKWGDLAQGVPAKNLLFDGSLVLDLKAGTPTEKLDLQGPHIVSSEFALELDFYYEEGGTGSTFLGVGFTSMGDNNCNVILYLDERKWSIGLTDGSIESTGEIEDVLQGQWAHLQVLYYDSRMAAFLNGKLLGSVEGITHIGNDKWITAATQGEAKIRLDNLKFWNLDAGDSLEPILAYIAGTAPDFTDDFADAAFSSDKWGELAQDVPASNFLFDGSLVLDLEAGTPTEKLVLGGTNIDASQFALEFDFYYEGGTGSTFLGVGFTSMGDNNCDVTLYLDEGRWSFGLTDGSNTTGGEIEDVLQGQWVHLQVVYFDSQEAAFLNGKLLGSVDGITHIGNDKWIGAVTGGLAKVRLDNLKFWNLDDYSPDSAAFTGPIFDYAASTPPAYQEDFSAPQAYWEDTEVLYGVTMADRISGGVFQFSNRNDAWRNEGFSIPATGRDFLLEFDSELNFMDVSQHLYVFYRAYGEDYDDISFNPSSFGLDVRRGNASLVKPVAVAPDGKYHFQLLVRGNQLAVYINDELILYSDEVTPVHGEELNFGVHYKVGLGAKLDNIKFWNLDSDVLLENILAFMAIASPNFADDFSSLQPGWEARDAAGASYSLSGSLKDGWLVLPVEVGTALEKISLGHESFKGSQFALGLDFFFEGGGGATSLAVGFPSRDDQNNCAVFIELDNQRWSIRCSDGSADQGGGIAETLQGQWVNLGVVFAGGRLSAYLNGELLGSAGGVSHLGETSWIVAFSESGAAKVWLDDVKFWNLDGVSGSSTPAGAVTTPPPTAGPKPPPTATAGPSP